MCEYKGGVRWGLSLLKCANVSYPLGRLIIGDDQIMIRVPGSEFVLTKNHIETIGFKNRFFYQGVVFNHSSSDAPRVLVFWTFQGKLIQQRLSLLFPEGVLGTDV